jgi:hypothetical protein
MKRFAKILGVTCVAALALAAMTAAGASAAQFTASATGTLTGNQTGTQVFTASAGGTKITCTKAHTTGTIVSTAAASQHVTVAYSGCTVDTIFNPSATVTPATYLLFADGTVEIVSPIVIHVPILGCTTTVEGKQKVGKASYDNEGGKIKQTSAVTGIKSTSTGACPSGTTGEYSGTNLVERVGGGTLTWDA